MMTLLLYGLAAIGAAAITVSAWFVCVVCWIARGEPDARCDAEKDGGGM